MFCRRATFVFASLALAYASAHAQSHDSVQMFKAIRSNGGNAIVDVSRIINGVSSSRQETLVKEKDDRNRTALHLTAKYGTAAIAEFLLDHVNLVDRASYVQMVDRDGRTPLHVAVRYGRGDVVTFLLRFVAPNQRRRMIAEQRDHEGKTVLDYAVDYNYYDIDRELRACLTGRPLQILDNSQFFDAIKYGRNSEARILIDQVSFADRVTYVTTADNAARTPLHVACSKGNTELVKKIIDVVFNGSGSQDCQNYMMLQDNKGKTALHYAAQYGYDALAKELLHRVTYDKKKEFATITDHQGKTAMDYAHDYNYSSVVDVLYSVFQSFIGQNDAKRQKIEDAIRDGYEDIAIDHIKNISWFFYCDDYLFRVDDQGRTFLHLATKYGRHAVVKEILSRVSPSNRSDYVQRRDGKNGQTALHYACRYGYKEIAQELMQHVSWGKRQDFINVRDLKGKTAKDYAKKYGYKDVEKKLDSADSWWSLLFD